ncbi:MAG: TIGR03905 family TSCPD domain-containing protein [Clostridia bacterium]|nr:TIGR03905 family TSCPD domain-containing protein [Clostridia bacterium]
MHHVYYPKGVCSTKIDFDVEGGVVHNVVYTNGCNGNLQALGRLVEGMTVEEAIRRLRGIHCGGKSTSCGDQFARALESTVKGE